MLAPRISLKQLLIFVGVVACYFGIVSLAYRGNIVAFGLAWSIAGLSFVFLIYTFSYWLLYGLARLLFGQRQPLALVEESDALKQEQST